MNMQRVIRELIFNNIITNAVIGGGVVDYSESFLTARFSYNNVWNNTGGNYLQMTNLTGTDDNISVNPQFANATAGDYHLKSASGRWDPATLTWVKDSVTSPCIDKGNPATNCEAELWPHGGVVNLGAYGGTSQASKSTDVTAGNAADFNSDKVVNMADFALLSLHWMGQEYLSGCDTDSNNQIDINDLNTLAENWLWQE